MCEQQQLHPTKLCIDYEEPSLPGKKSLLPMPKIAVQKTQPEQTKTQEAELRKYNTFVTNHQPYFFFSKLTSVQNEKKKVFFFCLASNIFFYFRRWSLSSSVFAACSETRCLLRAASTVFRL
jgi:hypothetical protein